MPYSNQLTEMKTYPRIMRKDMKKCPKPLGYGIRRTPVVLGLSAALCMPAAFSYANVDNGMDRESVLSVMQGKTIKGQ